MYQGETITTTITDLPVSVSDIANVYIIFKTGSGKTLVEKTLKDCEVTDEAIEVRLTQEETLSFTQGNIQRSIIVITNDGARFESDPCTIRCAPTAKKEVLS